MAQSQLRHFLFPNLHVAALVTASHGWRGIAPGPLTAKRPSLFRQCLCSLCAARA